MKKLLTGLMVLGLCAGLFGLSSLLYAADPEPVESTDAQAEQEEEAAWEAWEADLEALLIVDDEYAEAVESLADYLGDDVEEYAILKDARSQRYFEIALIVYEEHFGEWTGTTEDFEARMEEIPVNPNIESCSAAAVLGCGKGKVCSMTSSPDGTCSYTCAGKNGVCGGSSGM